MPDANGRFLPEDSAKVLEWITEKTKNRACTFCGNTNWNVSDILVHLQVYYGLGEFRIGGPSIPAVSLACTNCGHLEFFSAIMMGVVPREPRPAAEATPQTPPAEGASNG